MPNNPHYTTLYLYKSSNSIMIDETKLCLESILRASMYRKGLQARAAGPPEIETSWISQMST
jgi:hypothetical protein